ncbi:apoptosis regulator E10 [Equid gammaherpesvirus 2]|nr:apoptosis regulator E10 [Equid gammaherpesvirus 2]UTM04621.1 apoptosis regulator E10 [Equid gammaherpesvirus 2]
MAEKYPLQAGDPCVTLTEEDIWDVERLCLEELRHWLVTRLRARKHLDHLRALRILSREDTEEILARVTSKGQAGLLLDMCQDHPKGFQGLKESCKNEVGQEHLVDLLERAFEKHCGDRLTQKWWESGADGRNPRRPPGSEDNSGYTALLPTNPPRGGESGGGPSIGSGHSRPRGRDDSGGIGGGVYPFSHGGARVVGGGWGGWGESGGAGRGGSLRSGGHSGHPPRGGPGGGGRDYYGGGGSGYYESIPEPANFPNSGGGGRGGGVRYDAGGDGRLGGLPPDPQEVDDPSLSVQGRGGPAPDPPSPPLRTRRFFCC